MPIKLLIVLIAAFPLVGMAQQTQYLVGIPGVSGSYSVPQLINALYLLAISIAALLAVIKIVIAGAKYMLSDVVTSKQDALKDIRGALLGLLIVLAAFLILNTINEQLVQLDALETIQPVGGGGGGSGGSGNGWGGTAGGGGGGAGGTSGGSTGGGTGGVGYDPNATYTYVESFNTDDPLNGETFTIVGWQEEGVAFNVYWTNDSLNSSDGSPSTIGCGDIQPSPTGCT